MSPKTDINDVAILEGTKEIMTIMSNSSGGSPRFSNTGKSNLLNIMVANHGYQNHDIISPPRYAEEPMSKETSLDPLE